ncbi:FKBP-type peptidyl-prolyl cis-trans isomerase [Salmonella enterica]|nr:FKBP-type peptidyl-prolyl cis-trans isomerase [Salmonella enterica]
MTEKKPVRKLFREEGRMKYETVVCIICFILLSFLMAFKSQASVQTSPQSGELTGKEFPEKWGLKNNPLSDGKKNVDIESSRIKRKETESLSQQVTETNKNKESFRISYAAGMMFARNITRSIAENQLIGVGTDRNALIAGLNDVLTEAKPILSVSELQDAVILLDETLHTRLEDVKAEQVLQNKLWLSAFTKNTDVKKEDDGVFFRVINAGEGGYPELQDIVNVSLKESLPDGTVVSDMGRTGSSLRKYVKEFPPVFARAITHLQEGGEIILAIPPELAYGDKGFPPVVKPGSLMIYNINLLGIIKERGKNENTDAKGDNNVEQKK